MTPRWPLDWVRTCEGSAEVRRPSAPAADLWCSRAAKTALSQCLQRKDHYFLETKRFDVTKLMSAGYKPSLLALNLTAPTEAEPFAIWEGYFIASEDLDLTVYMYMYICVYMYMCEFTYIYIYT